MALNHKLQKLLIYFRSSKPYWRTIEHSNWKEESKTGPFFGIHLKDRLNDNHYDLFDERGLPIRGSQDHPIYNYTTICSFALAHYELYLETGKELHTEPLMKALEFLQKEHERTGYGGIVFPFKGKLSAMNQGEALAVVARAYELEPDPSLKTFAEDIIKAYTVSIEEYGVKGSFSEFPDVYWYEERAELPAKHILNGMLYALIGLYDILQVFPDIEGARELWESGLEYVERALPLFDTGRWSWYWMDEEQPNYIASMMYHNLHICQLGHLYNVTGREPFNQYARKFEGYQNSFSNRIRAGVELYKGKRTMK